VAQDRPRLDADPGSSDPAAEAGLGVPGKPFSRRAPYLWGLLAGLGLVTAIALGRALETVGGAIFEVVVSMFIAAGLNPLVRWFERRGMRRNYAVLVVTLLVLAVLALFLVALVPVIAEQVTRITDNAPGWLNSLQSNKSIQKLNDDYHIIGKIKAYVADGHFVSSLFGGVLGFGLKVLGAIFNTIVIVVLTLYFLAGYEDIKKSLYRLAPASRRERVTLLGERVFDGIGGYVSGAFVIALCAGLSTLVFLFIAGMGQYAVALAFVVMVTDVIPMIGATIGAVIVSAIGFATSPGIGIACVVFYIVYQQVENYLIYPRIMSRSVDVPGAVTVIAALIGASLLGVAGALLAVPAAAAILMLVREVFIRAQDER